MAQTPKNVFFFRLKTATHSCLGTLSHQIIFTLLRGIPLSFISTSTAEYGGSSEQSRSQTRVKMAEILNFYQ